MADPENKKPGLFSKLFKKNKEEPVASLGLPVDENNQLIDGFYTTPSGRKPLNSLQVKSGKDGYVPVEVLDQAIQEQQGFFRELLHKHEHPFDAKLEMRSGMFAEAVDKVAETAEELQHAKAIAEKFTGSTLAKGVNGVAKLNPVQSLIDVELKEDAVQVHFLKVLGEKVPATKDIPEIEAPSTPKNQDPAAANQSATLKGTFKNSSGKITR